MVPRIWQAHSNHVTVCRRGRVWRLCTWHAHLTITPAARSAGEEEEARLVHVCTGARGAEIPCHSTLQRWTGLFGRCCRLSRPWCAQEQIIDEVCSRNGRLPKVTARADAGSSKASSRSLLQSSQVPFPPRSPGPCHPATTTVGGFFYFFCFFSLFWFPLPRHSDRLFARGQREARRREQGGRVRGGMDSGSAVRAKLVRAVCGGLLESGVRLPMLRRLARHAQRECFCAPTCSDAARARAGRYVAQAKRTPSRLCVQ